MFRGQGRWIKAKKSIPEVFVPAKSGFFGLSFRIACPYEVISYNRNQKYGSYSIGERLTLVIAALF